MNSLPKSKGTWGREAAKSPVELHNIAVNFFESIKFPLEWKFERYDRAEEKKANGELIIHSIGALFTDTRTRGLDLKRYRVFILTWSGKGGIVERSIIDFGKYTKKCLLSNKTAEQLSLYIDENYRELSEQLSPQEIDPDDGLQHFRDRFADRVAD